MSSNRTHGGKGSAQRPTNHETFSDNYDKIFGRTIVTDSRMPCGITDDPYNDYSDYIEDKGVYSQPTEEDDDVHTSETD